jgi:Rieske Fe-S protein
MDRREFTKRCLSCVGATALVPLLTQCQSTHYTTGTLESSGIAVLKSEFKYLKKEQELIRSYIVVRNESMQFPIYLYRFAENAYSAVLMKCTHQGNELSASGDHLTCSAHGSEFNNRGNVAHGPAEKNLRTFPVTADSDRIFIDLRA